MENELAELRGVVAEAEHASELLGVAKPVPYAVELKGRITRDMVEEISSSRASPTG
jgi:hypothetical protein